MKADKLQSELVGLTKRRELLVKHFSKTITRYADADKEYCDARYEHKIAKKQLAEIDKKIVDIKKRLGYENWE